MHSGSRAIFGADRVRTVVAGNGKRISKYVIADPALPGRDETSALDFIDAAETTAYFQIVLSLQATWQALQPEQREESMKNPSCLSLTGG
ncbi:hypothetical protein SEEH3547_21881 [Salmonella enterica subsp. enterica serovar Heidelberg str. 75-3547]|nr:hypothetical protein SEEH3547_21881 [Salmonella enterica subsp. enterica serovar Heidelberg str. 75-3547]